MIKRFKNIILVGTSHISKDSIVTVEEAISKYEPTVMALELDPARFNTLFIKRNQKKSGLSIKKTGVKRFFFALIGSWIEKRLGKITKSSPGSEMKHAAVLAQKNKMKIALIDQHINITLKNISKRITLKEKARFAKDIVKSFFSSLPKDIDIRRVPKDEQIASLTLALKEQYPSVYQTIITDRDVYMSKALYKISIENYKDNVMAVVGAGHLAGIINQLKREKWPIKNKAKKK